MSPRDKEDLSDDYYAMASSTLVKIREALDGIYEVLLSAQVLFMMIFLLSLLFTSSFRTWAAAARVAFRGCRLWCRVPTSGS